METGRFLHATIFPRTGCRLRSYFEELLTPVEILFPPLLIASALSPVTFLSPQAKPLSAYFPHPVVIFFLCRQGQCKPYLHISNEFFSCTHLIQSDGTVFLYACHTYCSPYVSTQALPLISSALTTIFIKLLYSFHIPIFVPR